MGFSFLVRRTRGRYALEPRRVKLADGLGSGLESCPARGEHNSRPDPKLTPSALIQTEGYRGAGIGYHSRAIRTNDGEPMTRAQGAERLPDRWDEQNGGGDERAGQDALPLEPPWLRPQDHQFRGGTRRQRSKRPDPLTGEAVHPVLWVKGSGGDLGSMKSTASRPSTSTGCEPCSGSTAASRTRTRWSATSRTAPSTSTRVQRASTRRCMPTCPARMSTTCTPTR